MLRWKMSENGERKRSQKRFFNVRETKLDSEIWSLSGLGLGEDYFIGDRKNRGWCLIASREGEIALQLLVSSKETQ